MDSHDPRICTSVHSVYHHGNQSAIQLSWDEFTTAATESRACSALKQLTCLDFFFLQSFFVFLRDFFFFFTSDKLSAGQLCLLMACQYSSSFFPPSESVMGLSAGLPHPI